MSAKFIPDNEDPLRQLQATEKAQTTWYRTILIYLTIQAIIGFIAIEFAFSRTIRYREVDEVRDGRFPWFRRYDA